MKPFKTIRPLDYIVLLLALAALAFSFFAARTPSAATRYVVITSGGSSYYYPLTKSRQISVPGSLGVSIIAIEEGKACFLDSPCQNKICQHAGWLSQAGAAAACLPNGVIMHIEGK